MTEVELNQLKQVDKALRCNRSGKNLSPVMPQAVARALEIYCSEKMAHIPATYLATEGNCID